MVNYNIQLLKDVPDHLDWLHPSELKIYSAFRYVKRRNDWILGRWTAKNLVRDSCFRDRKLSELAVLPGQNRAPFVYLNEEPQSCIVSISHSHGHSLCVSTDSTLQLGCDLEKVVQRSRAFMKDYFSLKEHQLFSSGSHNLEEQLYYTLLWSSKEALMKATRKGLSMHPLKIEVFDIVHLNEGWKTLKLRDLTTEMVYFGFWQVRDMMIYTIVGDSVFDFQKP